MAMQLLRQSWKNHPLSPQEAAQLHSVGSLSVQAPGLRLLAHELLLSTSELSHLWPPSNSPTQPLPALDLDAGICYLKEAAPSSSIGWRGFSPNPRTLLTPMEEQRVLGIHPKPAPQPSWLREMRQTGRFQLHMAHSPVPEDLVTSLEAQLYSLVRTSPPQSHMPPYPLSSSSSSSSSNTPLEAETHKDLQASWDAHHTLPVAEINLGKEALQEHITYLKVNRMSLFELCKCCSVAFCITILKTEGQLRLERFYLFPGTAALCLANLLAVV
jgi:hypothetical protein